MLGSKRKKARTVLTWVGRQNMCSRVMFEWAACVLALLAEVASSAMSGECPPWVRGAWGLSPCQDSEEPGIWVSARTVRSLEFEFLPGQWGAWDLSPCQDSEEPGVWVPARTVRSLGFESLPGQSALLHMVNYFLWKCLFWGCQPC